MEDLERHGAVVLAVMGQVHRSHAAAAEFPLDGVLVRQRLFQPLEHRPALSPW